MTIFHFVQNLQTENYRNVHRIMATAICVCCVKSVRFRASVNKLGKSNPACPERYHEEEDLMILC